MKRENHVAFVIYAKPLGEADLRITFFSKEHGKISALAKGVRKISSRRRPSLTIFNKVNIQLVSSNFPQVTESIILNSFPQIRKDLRKMSVAYYLCDVLGKITPEKEPNPRVFELLESSLQDISSSSNLKIVRHTFIKVILYELGYVPQNFVFQDPDATLSDVLERDLPSLRVGRMLQ